MFPCLPLVPLMITQVVYEGGRHRVHEKWGRKMVKKEKIFERMGERDSVKAKDNEREVWTVKIWKKGKKKWKILWNMNWYFYKVIYRFPSMIIFNFSNKALKDKSCIRVAGKGVAHWAAPLTYNVGATVVFFVLPLNLQSDS